MNEVTGQLVKVTGASIYCATRGSGPVVLIMGGGPGNADTLEPLAARLAEDLTVVTYDRRGYSRRQLDDPRNPAGGELFIRRDVPAIGGYRLDLGRLRPVAGRLVVTGSEGSRDYYPYQCARRLAGQLGTPLLELPGDHAGMIRHPAEFAARLRSLLRPPDPAGTRTTEHHEGVTKCSS
jgi:pimeloyl-ACP methyl ester carboxylesterase